MWEIQRVVLVVGFAIDDMVEWLVQMEDGNETGNRDGNVGGENEE